MSATCSVAEVEDSVGFSQHSKSGVIFWLLVGAALRSTTAERFPCCCKCEAEPASVRHSTSDVTFSVQLASIIHRVSLAAAVVPQIVGRDRRDVAEWTSTSASERRFACVVSPEPPSASCSDIEEALGSMRTPSSTSSEDEEVISAGHGQSVSREEVDGVQVAAVLSGQGRQLEEVRFGA